MYRGFNIRFGRVENYYQLLYLNIGHEIKNENINNTKNIFRELFEKEINVQRIQEEWYPQIKADIFLSHSHKDEKLAIAFAGFLKHKFGLRVFIDSSIWKNIDDLQNIINNNFSRNQQGNYQYDKVKSTASHANMILATSLMMMIDNCECLFFLNTPNTVKFRNSIGTYTNSPWIYYEMLLSKYIRNMQRRTKMMSESYGKLSSPSYMYPMNITHLKLLDEKTIDNWVRCFYCDKKMNPLDLLYKIVDKSSYIGLI
ncbi:hypothetical protein [Capnocytophaga canimorsus]|uniref:hypothetical protein n=1 Tax=Capnocytophaga canimorsus TaxID=28188 RepID=UPI0038580F9E